MLALRKTGLILALLGTIWFGAWPFLGFGEGPGSVFAIVIGVCLMWEGFGRIARSRGLPKLYGAWSLVVLSVHVLLRVVWAGPTHNFQPKEVEAHYLAISLSYVIVPAALSWASFYIAMVQAKRRA